MSKNTAAGLNEGAGEISAELSDAVEAMKKVNQALAAVLKKLDRSTFRVQSD